MYSVLYKKLPLAINFSFQSMFKDVPENLIENGKWPILSWPCEPGDCVVFHGKTLHGAHGNESKNLWRRVLSTRWIGQDARMTTRLAQIYF